jgi:hypothetical protein
VRCSSKSSLNKAGPPFGGPFLCLKNEQFHPQSAPPAVHPKICQAFVENTKVMTPHLAGLTNQLTPTNLAGFIAGLGILIIESKKEKRPPAIRRPFSFGKEKRLCHPHPLSLARPAARLFLPASLSRLCGTLDRFCHKPGRDCRKLSRVPGKPGQVYRNFEPAPSGPDPVTSLNGGRICRNPGRVCGTLNQVCICQIPKHLPESSGGVAPASH